MENKNYFRSSDKAFIVRFDSIVYMYKHQDKVNGNFRAIILFDNHPDLKFFEFPETEIDDLIYNYSLWLDSI